MTDPSPAMHSFQQALLDGELELHRGTLHPELYFLRDDARGKLRFIYMTLQKNTVTAFAMFVLSGRVEGMPCFQVGYAVPESYRCQGRAKGIVGMAIAELQHGFAPSGAPAVYVEAVVGTDNPQSQRVAFQSISATPETIADSVSGLPALYYLRKIDLTTPEP